MRRHRRTRAERVRPRARWRVAMLVRCEIAVMSATLIGMKGATGDMPAIGADFVTRADSEPNIEANGLPSHARR